MVKISPVKIGQNLGQLTRHNPKTEHIFQSDSSTFANSQVVKKTRTETSGSLEEALAAKKVTITLEGFPKVKMNVEQLTALRASIEEAQEDIPEELWPISFTRCNYKSGSMVVTCEDAKSARWLMEAVPILHPWKGARLQAKQEDVIPNFCVCRAFFPDKGGQKLETERVLKKLRVSNRGLNTSLWTVNKCIPLEKGHIWYFSMDKVSRKVLGDLSMVASFGMKRLKFSEIGSAKKKNHAVIAATPSTSLAFKETGKEADKNEDVPEATATCQSEPMEEEIIDLCSYED
ncbi:unnamed protein product [Brassicogethes aeneus]|uniref:DUF4780 domain-containing protein n=1 Tax=Brassicogethes aeneus TaxID=1431903 RepID=A0A9P0FES5_BRAAE|nr:unnamed protein product [Brassicogethes aeneus]